MTCLHKVAVDGYPDLVKRCGLGDFLNVGFKINFRHYLPYQSL